MLKQKKHRKIPALAASTTGLEGVVCLAYDFR